MEPGDCAGPVAERSESMASRSEHSSAIRDSGDTEAEVAPTGACTAFNHVLNLVRGLSAAPEDPLSAPLTTVSSWERGGQSQLFGVPAALPITRITIDSRGIKAVERLAERPRQSGRRSDDAGFVFGDESQLRGINAKFKVFIASPTSLFFINHSAVRSSTA